MEKRYSPRQLSQQLDVHLTTIWRWLTTGVKGRILTSRLYGGRRYVLDSDLQKFLGASKDVLSGETGSGTLGDVRAAEGSSNAQPQIASQ